jgi:Holliday junction DNA helicase RuvA
MIARLRGTLSAKAPGEVLIDCGGVGYQVFVSLSTFCRLPAEGDPVELAIVTNLRENALELFGFHDPRERALFGLLRGVSGIGPRLALSILSGIEPEDLLEVLERADVGRLVAIPGVGKKTAERVLVELRGRLDTVSPASTTTGRGASIEADAVAALVGLGYKQTEAEAAVAAARDGEAPAIEGLIKRALAELA